MAKTPPNPDAFDPKVNERAQSYQFFLMASQSMGLAQRFIPILCRFILVMSGIAVLAMVTSLVSVYLRHDPQVLLTFPDGATRCAMPPLDPATRQPKPRPDWEEEVCQKLSQSSFDDTDTGAPR